MHINELKTHINKKSRLIGVDMGSKRVGLSISDENRKIASTLKTIDYKNIEYLANEIQKIVKESGIDAIIFDIIQLLSGQQRNLYFCRENFLKFHL